MRVFLVFTYKPKKPQNKNNTHFLLKQQHCLLIQLTEALNGFVPVDLAKAVQL